MGGEDVGQPDHLADPQRLKQCLAQDLIPSSHRPTRDPFSSLFGLGCTATPPAAHQLSRNGARLVEGCEN